MLAACGGSAPAAVDSRRAPVCAADVVATFPHSPEAFTQGLELHDGMLYESTGLHRHSSVRIEELASGTLRAIHTVPDEHYAEGLTILDGRVYELTYQTGTCFVYDAVSLEPIAERHYDGEGWGLTHLDGLLVMSDGTSVLRFVDPETFSVRRTLPVHDGPAPVDRLNELEVVEGAILANVWTSDRIARIDARTGAVTSWIDLAPIVASLALAEPQAVLNGIAYDEAAHRLFVTGKLWPTVFEIRPRC